MFCSTDKMTDLYRLCHTLEVLDIKYRAEQLSICLKNSEMKRAGISYKVVVGASHTWAFNSSGAYIGTWFNRKLIKRTPDNTELKSGSQFVSKIGPAELTVVARSTNNHHIMVTNDVADAPDVMKMDALKFDWKPKP